MLIPRARPRNTMQPARRAPRDTFMQIRRKVLLLGAVQKRERKKKECSKHQPNKSRCSDSSANSIGQTTDTGGIKRDGRLKISLNCHDNRRAPYTHAGPAAVRFVLSKETIVGLLLTTRCY